MPGVTYEDVRNVDSLGVGTFGDDIRVVGTCTATAVGDGSQLAGIAVGIDRSNYTIRYYNSFIIIKCRRPRFSNRCCCD